MSDISKLPKWAQKEMKELRANQSTHNVGANVTNCHFEHVGIKHSPETVTAICSIADAFTAHAEALKELAKSVNSSNNQTLKEPLLNFSEINTPK